MFNPAKVLGSLCFNWAGRIKRKKAIPLGYEATLLRIPLLRKESYLAGTFEDTRGVTNYYFVTNTEKDK